MALRFGIVCFSLAILFLIQACSFTKNIKTGEQAFERKQYAVAVELFEEEYEKEDNANQRGRIAYLMAKSFEFLNDYKSAVFWFGEAIVDGYGSEAYRDLAYALKHLEDYRGAIAAFENLKQNSNADARLINREIGICRDAARWKKAGANSGYRIESMGFNTSDNEYSPTLYEKNYLVYSSDNTVATGGDEYKWSGRDFSDILIIGKSGGYNQQIFDDELNTIHNEGTACFNKDFTKIFFTRCFNDVGDDYCAIYTAHRNFGGWSEAEAIFPVQEGINMGHPALIENDSVLVFSSNVNAAESGFDLFYSVLEETGWSLPEAMPSNINTQGNEKFPTADGDTLYFSSDYLPGLGGLDIFQSYLKKDGSWDDPKNMAYPLNRGSDDFGYIVDRTIPPFGNTLVQGFFSSNRTPDRGDDIFKFSKIKIEREIIPADSTAIVEAPQPKKIRLALRVVENIYETDGDPFSEIIGKEPIRSVEVIRNIARAADTMFTNSEGRIIMELKPDSDFEFGLKKQGYFPDEFTLSTVGIDEYELLRDTTINRSISLDEIFANLEITLDNIYYDFNKWDIREDAKSDLNYLISLLRDNPEMRIELSSHTDCRGDNDYNKDLSQKRAESAVAYLISQGIEEGRLVARGYGEERPSANCSCYDCSEDQHQINRRTSFTVLE